MGLIMRRNLMAAKSGYTAKDYVQDGLVMQYDGIEHGDDPDFWQDLKSSLHYKIEGYGYEWTGDSLLKPSGVNSVYSDQYLLPNGISDLTLEVVCSVRSFTSDGIDNGLFGVSSGQFRLFNSYTRGSLCSRFFASATIEDLATFTFGRKSFLFARGVEGRRLFVDNSLAYSNSDYGETLSDSRMSLFSFSNLRLMNADSEAEFCAIRLYNRELGDDERNKNYAIDKARFNLKDVA